MLTPLPTSDCLLAREAASARLDHELSEHEEARLESHLRECAECSAYARDLAATAAVLRAAPLERPDLDLALPSRSALPGLRIAAAAAAVLAVAAGSGIALEQGLRSESRPVTAISVAPNLVGQRADKRDQPLFALLGPSGPQKAHHVGRIGYA